jgi:hypothetical protein
VLLVLWHRESWSPADCEAAPIHPTATRTGQAPAQGMSTKAGWCVRSHKVEVDSVVADLEPYIAVVAQLFGL